MYQLITIALCDTGEVQYTFRLRVIGKVDQYQHVREQHPRAWQIAHWFDEAQITAPCGKRGVK